MYVYCSKCSFCHLAEGSHKWVRLHINPRIFAHLPAGIPRTSAPAEDVLRCSASATSRGSTLLECTRRLRTSSSSLQPHDGMFGLWFCPSSAPCVQPSDAAATATANADEFLLLRRTRGNGDAPATAASTTTATATSTSKTATSTSETATTTTATATSTSGRVFRFRLRLVRRRLSSSRTEAATLW